MTFSLNPARRHYVRLPSVDPSTEAGKKAIWKTMTAATKGLGFAIDGDDIVPLNGLKIAPLWPNGAPYPTTLYYWLRQTSHQKLRDLIDQAGTNGRPKANDRYSITESKFFVAMDHTYRLYVLSLRKTSDDFTYEVTIMPQDPNMQLIPKSRDTGLHFTQMRGCTLYDRQSWKKNGALNMSLALLETLSEGKWKNPGGHAILVAEFDRHQVALTIPGAEEFLLIESAEDWEQQAGKVLSALQQAQHEGPEAVKLDHAISRASPELKEGGKYAFAVKMPTGNPVAGVMEVRAIDHGAKTLTIRHRFLPTAAARTVFSEDEDGTDKAYQSLQKEGEPN